MSAAMDFLLACRCGTALTAEAMRYLPRIIGGQSTTPRPVVCEACEQAELAVQNPAPTRRVPIFLDEPGVRHGRRATWERGCRCTPCSRTVGRPGRGHDR